MVTCFYKEIDKGYNVGEQKAYVYIKVDKIANIDARSYTGYIKHVMHIIKKPMPMSFSYP